MDEAIHVDIEIVDVWVAWLEGLGLGLVGVFDEFWVSHGKPFEEDWNSHCCSKLFPSFIN